MPWHCWLSLAQRQQQRHHRRWCLSVRGRTTVPQHQRPSLAGERSVVDNGASAMSAVPRSRDDKSRSGGADNGALASMAVPARECDGGGSGPDNGTSASTAIPRARNNKSCNSGVDVGASALMPVPVLSRCPQAGGSLVREILLGFPMRERCKWGDSNQ